MTQNFVRAYCHTGLREMLRKPSYRTRTEAGNVIANLIREKRLVGDFLVLAIPNGGVEVAAPIAKQLKSPLDIIIVRKLQIPSNPEAGFGALTSLGTMILNEQLVRSIGIDSDSIERVKERTELQIESRCQAYRGISKRIDPTGKDIVLVDDGLASGFTMLAAIESVHKFNPESVRVAIPTAHHESLKRVEPLIDEIICPRIEHGFSFAVANAYELWYDVPDEEVIAILQNLH
jgi:putative phosphoribosyl transferase